MLAHRVLYFALLTALPASLGLAQEGSQVRPPATALSSPSAAAAPAQEQTIPLTVPKGVPLEIAVSENVHVKKAGQEIHGQLVRPVYAFDQLVLPAGTEAKGHIAKIDSISAKRRVFGILNGDFTPAHNVQVEFTDLQLPDGKHISFQAVITPGSGQAIQLVSAKDDEKKKGVVQDAAAKKVDEAKREARQAWQQAMKQVKEPGKVRRLEQYAMAQLPIRPQYLHSGTVYYADLQQPIYFGSEPLPPALTPAFGTPLPTGSLVHALLATPLDSATTQKGAEVEAVLSQPLFEGDRLVLPEGCRLKGNVVQVRPARHWHHNGQLRIVFREIVPPDGIEQRVVAGLESVQAARNDHVKLDSEGGAEATSPRTRYASLALTLALTTAAFRQHTDSDDVANGQANNGAAGGTAGFKLVGMALGFAVKSQPVGMAMGAYGSARSIYSTFIAKGREVVFPKNTPMEISLGSPRKTVLPTPQPGSPTAEPKP
jgi:hypothetical protein